MEPFGMPVELVTKDLGAALTTELDEQGIARPQIGLGSCLFHFVEEYSGLLCLEH
jgi:hypothetical protein